MDRWLQRVSQGRMRVLITALILVTAFLVSSAVMAMPAYPGAVYEMQPDGSSIELRIKGDEHFNWMEDAAGYTVIQSNGWYQYAQLDAGGNLVSTGLNVGQADPKAEGLQTRVLPSEAIRAQSMLSMPNFSGPDAVENVPPNGTVKNLVVLVRFSDHTGRTQPTEADINVLMNVPGGDPILAPNGSVRDVYLENSYGQMTLDSTVMPWKTVTNTEAYYANGDSGDSTLWEALREALTAADATINFNDYDTDNDGFIDSITFLHSGYAAEWGGTDAYGANYLDRIWSHRWSIQPSWLSAEGVRVGAYHISPAVWGTSGNDIGRIGVIAHETGHFFGLPDLYDTNGGGEGIGSWGLMANSWDFNFTQNCPPHFSPWSKVQLGWYTPTVIAAPGIYNINQAETNAEAYRIDAGFPSNEYLMIENRQNAGFDCTIPQGGLVIWHIDDSAPYNNEGYPGQAGWPTNGSHYRVAVLQADGLYDLEHGNDRGDAGDVHRGGGVDAIGPGPGGHPNTDTYQSGNVIQTGHVISDISASGASMSFCLNGCTGMPAPSSLAAVASGSASINLSWTDNTSDEDGFEIERSPNGSSWAALTTTAANATAFADNGLNSGTTYYYRARAFKTGETSGWSNTANATTDDVPPANPTGLNATANGQNRIDLAWTDASDNEDGFRILRSLDGSSFSQITTVGVGVTSYSNTGLNSATTYYYRVYSFNTLGDSAGYTADSATTDAPPPIVHYLAYADQFGSGLVTGGYANTHTDNGVNQSIEEQVSGGKKRDRTTYMGHFWRFNIGDGDFIRVFANAYQSASGDGDNFDFTWSDNDSNYDQPGHQLFTVSSTSSGNTELGTIPNSVSGQVWIRVIDSDRTPGNSSSRDTLFVDQLYIEVENTGPPTAPAAPSSLAATSGYIDRIDLTWSDNSPNEQGFRIERSLDGATGWALIASPAANATSYSNTGLTDNTTYYYRVLAWNGVGDSGWSNTAMATTDEYVPITVPAAPSGLSATSNGSNSILLAWTDNADNETGFWIQRSLNGTSFSTVASIGPQDTEAYNDTSVSPSTTYYYQVLAVNSLYQSAPSNIDSAMTGAAANITLSVSAYKSKGKKNFDLSWAGAVGTNVDVYFNGSQITTTANDGAYTNATNQKGGGTDTHQVCNAGTAVCSNIATTVW